MTKIRIFTGKGGVGKTSVAVASAWKAAERGDRTLLASTDAAHSIGDALDRRIRPDAVSIAERLDAVELDADRLMEGEYGDLVRSVTTMAEGIERGRGTGAKAGEHDAANDDAPESTLPILPGFDGLFSLLKLLDYAESDVYDTIVVDCAPTGETLALLKFPELLGWYVEKWLPLGKAAVRMLSPLSRTVLKVELPDKRAMSDIERLYARLIDLQQLLKDPDRTTVRIVTLPEKMVVEETKRNYLYLNLFGYRVDGLIVNRVLPPESQSGFFVEWADLQRRCMDELAQVFSGVLIARIPWYGSDICGSTGVAQLAAALPDEGVFAAASPVEHERYRKSGEGWTLELALPLADKDALELFQAGSDLVVRVGPMTRCIPLPNVLADFDVVGARLEEGVLRVAFAKGDRDER